ncbi:MAG: HepT-like ribonuclease domain-containing protein [Candidatus Nezhaarchaeales archaeon]
MRVKRQFSLVESYFRDFLRFRGRGESVYAVERVAQLLIQSILDTGAMMAVELGLRKPESYKGLASLIAEKLGLSVEDERFLSGLAGFRNLLVHGYAEVNRELEEEAFKEIEDRLGKIVEALRKFIDGLGDPGKGLNQLGERLRGVFERYKVRYAVLFGSMAREGVGRDFDIAVSMDAKSALELGELLTDMAEALSVKEEQIDLVHVESAGLGMLYTILNEGVLIYGNPEEAKEHLYKRYLELLDLASRSY